MQTKMWLIVACMIALGSLPIQLPQLKKYMSGLFVFGTGALFGLCVFHLFPNFIKLGGNQGLGVAVLVGLIYSAAHLLHSWQHADTLLDGSVPSKKTFSPYFFISAFVGHGLVSGLFLGFSNQFNHELAENIFWALLVHKVFEALVVATAIRTYHFSKSQIIRYSFLYWGSLPFGFYISLLPLNGFAQPLVLLSSGIALGSLAGCLIFDFLVPSFQFLKKELRLAAWLAIGFAIALLAPQL